LPDKLSVEPPVEGNVLTTAPNCLVTPHGLGHRSLPAAAARHNRGKCTRLFDGGGAE